MTCILCVSGKAKARHVHLKAEPRVDAVPGIDVPTQFWCQRIGRFRFSSPNHDRRNLFSQAPCRTETARSQPETGHYR